MSDRLVMGFWDCPYCDSKGILGTIRECPNCGKHRGKDTKFYMKSKNHDEVVRNNHYLTEEQSKTKGKGQDWECSYCGGLNSVLDKVCISCGHPRESSDLGYFQMREREENQKSEQRKTNETISDEKEFDIDEDLFPKPDLEQFKPILNQVRQEYKESIRQREEPKREKFSLNINWKPFLILGAVLSFIFLLIWLFVPHEKTLHVLDKEWEYSIDIERYQQVHESDWSLPSGAELEYTQREIHHYDEVLDHYETKTRTYTERVQVGSHTEYSYSDNGDGTFTEHSYQVPDYENVTRTETYQEPVYRDEPVYKTKYYYTVWKWLHERYVTTSGIDTEPYYGEVVLKDKEREGQHHEKYVLKGFLGKNDDKVKLYSIDKSNWFYVESGSDIKVMVNNLNQITEIIREE